MVTIVFGDSIAWGAYDLKEGGWVERAKKEGLHTGDIIYNCSVSGDSALNIHKRITGEIKSRMDQDDDLRVIIATGINDASRISGKLRTDPMAFISHMAHIVSRSIRLADEVIIIGPTCVDETRTSPVSWDSDLSYKNADILEFDNKLRGIAMTLGAIYVPAPVLSADELTDGVHLTDTGHEKYLQHLKGHIFKIRNKK